MSDTKIRIHVVALPHVKLGTPYTHLCAYSGKVMKFCKMMGTQYDVFLYAPEGGKIEGVKRLFNCLSDAKRIKIFGKDDKNRLPNWPTDEQSQEFNDQVIDKLVFSAQPRDLILLSGGWTHKAIADKFPAHIKCEPFCGYEGIISPFQAVPGSGSHVAFESYFHMAQVYAKKGINDIRWYDRVIPPFVDAAEFQVKAAQLKQLLFIGRAISRKGPNIALQVAKAAGLQLVVAGSGWTKKGNKLIGNDVELEGTPKQLKYVGPVSIAQRARLMTQARALICPTTYFEPGGNVAIEAQMAGCPVICPDSGVFAETVVNGLTGFHFRTLGHAVSAVDEAKKANREMIKECTQIKYSLESIRRQYTQWFNDMLNLWGEGWNTLHKNL